MRATINDLHVQTLRFRHPKEGLASMCVVTLDFESLRKASMHRSEANRYELPLSKQHETNMQDVRHERKSEAQRLERLKKTLQTKLHADRKESRKIRAA